MIVDTRLKREIKKKNILVVGDVMLDIYLTGSVERISPEAPVPVFKKRGENCVLGGAGNVAANLLAAGQKVSIMSIFGKDAAGDKLRGIFDNNGINTNLVHTLSRNTTEKTRFLANNHQQVLRLDVEDTEPINEDECNSLLEKFKSTVQTFDLIIISDYMKGLLTYDLTQGVIALANEYDIPVIVDVKDDRTEKYNGATILKPNLRELAELTGKKIDKDDSIIAASDYLRRNCECEYVLTTCGARGMVLVGDGEPYFINAVGQEVYDVTGAGDTAIAYLGTCIANGYPIRAAVDISNIAAGIQVAKVGTSSVYWSEIWKKIGFQNKNLNEKLISKNNVAEIRKQHPEKKIVFTNGCFDILHIGHIRYLKEASKLGDILIIGLNSDASVKRLKGRNRPINGEDDRAEVLSSLNFVDYVVIFDEDTPIDLINNLEPDVLVKGGDYEHEYVIGTREVEEKGGKLVLVPFIEGKSTTKIISKLIESQA